VAVGDVHGDLAGLAEILRERSLITKKGNWKGDQTHLVLTGDLLGGANARLLLEFILRLGDQASDAGGAVHSLLGNHDVIVFSKEPKKQDGKTLFRKYRVKGARGRGPRAAFRGETDPARWLRERNVVIRIGRTIFTHAGLNTWALIHHPARVNATVRAWIRFWQGVDVEPDARTGWVVAPADVEWEDLSSGPLWTRSYKAARKQKQPRATGTAPDLLQLERILRRYRTDRMVVGHAPVSGGEILLDHPYYGERVIMIDTRISDPEKGRLSSLEVTGGELSAHYADRTGFGETILKRELKSLKATP
jgi:hypothetical protein